MDGDIFYGRAYGHSGAPVHQPTRTRYPGGFGADDYEADGVDLNEQLIGNRSATFFMRVKGDAMVGAGIHDGDLVIVDRSVKPASGKVVIATLNSEMLIRRLEKVFNRIRLLPETSRLSPIDIDPSCESFSIWGVVTYCIHNPG